VAIRATNDTLGNFALNFHDGRSIANHLAHVRDLARQNVIEFHDDRIDQSAINARVVEEVGFDEVAIARTIGSHAPAPSGIERAAVAMVIRSRIAAPARDTDRVRPPRSLVADAVVC
jgi:hypothetical protein